MPEGLIGALFELTDQVVGDVSAVVGVDEAESVEAASLSVPGPRGRVLRQVGLWEESGMSINHMFCRSFSHMCTFCLILKSIMINNGKYKYFLYL